jgi:muramoyltetrapeptide carboxypeptidase LdcA involved in peptidoglycan recycling
VRQRTARADIPLLGNVDLRHTDPMLTLPLVARARLDAAEQSLKLLELPTCMTPR